MPSRKIFKRRGQALVLYALLIPLLFLFVGMGIDLGWYFINVSRLQNAADAAALAGAQALVKENEAFEDYYVVSLRSNNLPKDFDSYETLFTDKYKFGTLSKYPTNNETKNTLKSGRVEAEEYIRKNLSDAEFVDGESTERTALGATDGWSNSSSETGKKVSGTVELRYKLIDARKNVLGPRYYVVKLTEKIRHLFMPGWFDDMEAPVMAAVLLQPHDEGLITPMEKLERTMVIDNWEYQNKFRGTTGFYAGNWNHYQDASVHYTDNDNYRTESVTVKTKQKSVDPESSGNTTSANGNKFYGTDKVDSINIDFRAEIQKAFTSDWDLGQAVSGQSYTHIDPNNSWGKGNGDDKRILFNVEFNDVFPTRDESKQADPLWVRIESDPIKSLAYIGKPNHIDYNSVRQITLNFNKDNTIVEGDHYKYRPYVIFYTGPENIDYAKDSNGVLIRHSQPVVLNLNEKTNAIIYMPNSPVIINGNEKDLHGFVIAKCYLKAVTREDMTNGKTFQLYDGFNEYNEFKKVDKSNDETKNPKPATGDFDECTDGYGNTIYVKQNDLLTRETIDAAYPNKNVFTIIEDASGNLTVTEKIEAPQYPILSFTKDLYTGCTTLAEYFDATANYINSTYTKEKYMAFSGLSESQVSMIKFPDEPEVLRNASGIIPNPNTENRLYGNFTDITIPVATADLKDSDDDPDALTKDNKYVKVLVKSESSGDGSEPQYVTKYIAKQKLPYMRIKWKSNYPYVCIYDLKTGLGWGREDSFQCVRPMDNTTSTEDSAIVFTNSKNKNVAGSNQWGDVWVIECRLLEDVYNKEYIASKLNFVTEGDFKYFNRKSEIKALPKEPQVIAKYRKVIVGVDDDGKEIVKYFKEGTTYYTKVYNNATNHDNYIIVDENGNILTKPVTAPELRIPENVDSKAENEALKTNIGGTALYDYWNTYTRAPNANEQPLDHKENIINGKYRGNDIRHQTRDYRIPVWERVYCNTTFNLGANSYYSYFDIEELERVNYCYMNVDEINKKVKNPETGMWEKSDKWKVEDMFFTTVRAGWID